MIQIAASRLTLLKGHFCTSFSRKFTSIKEGSKYTASFKSTLRLPDEQIGSYFHDVPLDLVEKDGCVNMVVEIPRWTNAKFEINTKLPATPITHDIKKNEVRFVNNIFPHHGYMHNYGAIPQTWEDPLDENNALGLQGDGDPLDAIEIGSSVLNLGDVKRVKILGSLGLIDDGELDWKVVVIDVEDPLASQVDDFSQVEEKMPLLLAETRRWFKNYKRPTGKPENAFIFDGEYQSREQTLQVIKDCHKAWKDLVEGKRKGKDLPNIENATLKGTPGYKKFDPSEAAAESPDGIIPKIVDTVYFYTH